MAYSRFERMLIKRGGTAAQIGERLHAIRTRTIPKPKPQPLPKGVSPTSPLGQALLKAQEKIPEPVKAPFIAKPLTPAQKQIKTTTAPTAPTIKPGEVTVQIETKVDRLPDSRQPPTIDLRTISPSIIDTSKFKKPDVKSISPPLTYTYATGTPGQLTGKEGGFAPPKTDEGFYKPSVAQARRDKMALEKGYTIGRDPETKKPITVQQTPASYFHEYEPGFDEPEVKKIYTKVETNLEQNLLIAESNIEISKKAKENIPVIENFIKQLEQAKAGTTVTYTEISSLGEKILHENVQPSEALSFFRGHLTDLKTTAGRLSTSIDDVREIKNQQDIIGGYKKYGYVLEETIGGYAVERPKSSDVFFYKHGKEVSGVALSSAAFLASPLAIETVGSAIQFAVTGDKKVREAERERLSKYALGLDVSISRGDYFAKVIGSPAIVEGVYLPILTLGTSKFVSLGITGASPFIASGAGKASTFIGKGIPTTLKLVASDVAPKAKVILGATGRVISTRAGKQVLKYSIFLGLEGKDILETAATKPEMFGGRFGRSLFNFEIQWRALETGFKGTKFPRERKGFIEKDIFKTEGLPPTVKKQKIIGRIDVVQKPVKKIKTQFGAIYVEDTSKFRAVGKTFIKTEGEKPIKVLVEARGISKFYPPIKTSEAKGLATFRFAEREGLKKIERTSFRTFRSTGTEIFKIGKRRTIFSIEQTMGEIEPFTGESISDIIRIGKKEGKTLEIYFSKGKYENIIEDIVGEHKFIGVIKGLKGDKAAIDFGGKLVQELTTIAKTDIITPTLKLTTTKPATTISVGISKGITETIKYTTPKKVSVTKSAIAKIGETITRDILISKPRSLEMKKDTRQILISPTKQDLKEASSLKERQISILGEETILGTKELEQTYTGLITGQKPGVDLFDDELRGAVLIQDVSTAQTQKQLQGMLSISKLESALEIDSLLNIQPITITPSIITPNIPIIPILGEDEKGKRLISAKAPSGKGYNTLVKERSMFHGKIIRPTKFKKANIGALTKKDALGLGATIADETAAITFKIESTKEKPTTPLIKSKSFKQLEHKFTKKNDKYIEKNKYRLDSPGEQREISLLGRLSRKISVLSNKDLKINLKKNTNKKRGKNVRYF